MFKPSALGNSGAEVIAQVIENDVQNQSVDDNAVLASGIAEGTVVKWSKSLLKCVICDGTVALGSTDTIGIVSYANGTSGQVKFSGVYVDNDLATPGTYYCQSNGTIGTTVTKVFVGTVTSAGRLVMPGGGGSITPATPTSLGGVMAGVGLAITPEGLLSTASYPSWFTDRGDGSDGDYAPTESTTIAGGTYNFKSVNIPAGVVITLMGCVEIKCLGAFTCAGILTANGANGVSDTSNSVASCAGGGGCNGYLTNKGGDSTVAGSPGYGGGVGGASGAAPNIGAVAGGSNNGGSVLDLLSPITNKNYLIADKRIICGGGGGGAPGSPGYAMYGGGGGGGGASIYITAHNANVSGGITANGGNGGAGYNSGDVYNRSGGGGGGGGGAVVIVADTISNTGTITANGGTGGAQTNNSSYVGVAGSAGIVYLKELGAA